jgi:hypothetical protein
VPVRGGVGLYKDVVFHLMETFWVSSSKHFHLSRTEKQEVLKMSPRTIVVVGATGLQVRTFNLQKLPLTYCLTWCKIGRLCCR